MRQRIDGPRLLPLTVFLLTLLLSAVPVHGDGGTVSFMSTLSGAPRWHAPDCALGLEPVPWHYRVQGIRFSGPPQRPPVGYPTCYLSALCARDVRILVYRGSFDPERPRENLEQHHCISDDTDLPWGGYDYDYYGQELREDHDDELFIVTTAPLDVQATTQVTLVCPNMVPLLGACPSYFPTAPRDRQHCLHDRFPITIRWQTAANEGIAEPVRMGSRDTGMFWFFSPKNWEVMIKVLDGCSVNGHWWVFVAAMTNQGYEVRVGDSASLKWKTYTNQLGTRSPAFTDTTAFPCP